MNPKLCKRLYPAGCHKVRSVTIGSEADNDFEKTSVRDATLLLSVADICKSEIGTCGLTNIWRDDLTLPPFPSLADKTSPDNIKFLKPRPESVGDALGSGEVRSLDINPSIRIRAVSIEDSPVLRFDNDYERTTSSPRSLSPNVVTPMASPEQSNHRLPFRKQSLRLSAKARREYLGLSDDSDSNNNHNNNNKTHSFEQNEKSKRLQGTCAKGIPIKKIARKKFSWKNYPELEQFLIANREEYLRHSALNYTVQQKQYNNSLTEQLLELATEHGYIFDETEFTFVTVRDRIRCYYKSYVQSAKKRGILMGYAARKAGLLSEDELEKCARTAPRIIVTP